MNKIKLALFILFWFSLIGSSCETMPERTVDPITIEKKYSSIEILHPSLPEPVVWEEFEWTVITPTLMKNLLEKYNDGELTKDDLVFFGLSDKGYENLAKNMAEIIRYIEGQNGVIEYYKSTVPEKIIVENE